MFFVRAVPVLALLGSAFGLSVTAPTNTSGWTTSGDHTVSWSSVSTDPANFTIMLVNMANYPTYSQVLDALVPTSQGSTGVNPPSEGWPTGSGFQINLVASATQTTGILAQSEQFTITQSNSTSSSSSSSSSSSGSSSSSSASTPAKASSGSSSSGSSSSLNPSSSDTSTNPANSNAAAPLGVQAGLYGLVALLGVALA